MSFLMQYRYKTCVAIRLRVKSEGMSSTLFTMELASNSFTKMSDFEVYRLPWLLYMRHTFEFGIYAERTH